MIPGPGLQDPVGPTVIPVDYWTAEGSLYVAAVIDLFSRRVVRPDG
jgi:hypothetical protein